MGTFINPMTAFGFKYLFGREDSKDFLIDFLNNLLKDEPGFEPIVSLDYLDKEMSRCRKDERGVIIRHLLHDFPRPSLQCRDAEQRSEILRR